MLVLTRGKNQEICIGDEITLKVIEVGRGRVKIGIDAPRRIRVLRGELPDAVAHRGGTALQASRGPLVRSRRVTTG